jgi:hypothetical protein
VRLNENWADTPNLPPSGNGRTIAINEGFGFRPLLSVQSFQYLNAQGTTPQSTLVLGSQLMYQQIMEDRAGFVQFIRQYFGKPNLYTQLRSRLHESLEEFIYQWSFMGQILEVVPTAQAELTMITGGYDPLKGYWLQFTGFVPFFALPDWWDERPEWERYEE